MQRRRKSKSSDKATQVVGTILGGILANRALCFVDSLAIMQSPDQVNIKKAAVNGTVTLAAGAGAMAVDSPLACSILTGAATGAGIELTDKVIEPALGLSGLGRDTVDRLLDQFVGRNLSGPGANDNVPLAGPDEQGKQIKIA